MTLDIIEIYQQKKEGNDFDMISINRRSQNWRECYDVVSSSTDGYDVNILYPKGFNIKQIKRFTKIRRGPTNLKYTKSIDFFVYQKENGEYVLQPVVNKNTTIDQYIDIKTSNASAQIISHRHPKIKGDEPLPDVNLISTVKNKMSKDKEEGILREYVNYYLNDLGLNRLNLEKLDQKYNHPMLKLASIGDAYLSALVRSTTLETSYSQFVESNRYLQIALLRLGYKEWMSVQAHAAGSLFEIMVYCAIKQDNKLVISKLTDSLIGSNYIISNDDIFE